MIVDTEKVLRDADGPVESGFGWKGDRPRVRLVTVPVCRREARRSQAYVDLFSVTLHDDNVQEFDTRWDEVLLSMSKTPSDDDDLGKSVQIEDTSVCATRNCIRIARHGESTEDIDAQLSKIEDNGEEEYRSETPIVKL